MAPTYSPQYISVGANRSCSVASADAYSGVVAYGAGRVVALWDPRDASHRLTSKTLPGHEANITTLKHVGIPQTRQSILTGDEQGYAALWLPKRGAIDHADEEKFGYTLGWNLPAHTGSVSALGVLNTDDSTGIDNGVFLTGGNDGLVKVYTWTRSEDSVSVEEVQKISLSGRLPLDIAISQLPGSKALILAIALTERKIHLYTSSDSSPNFTKSLTLEGHEDWVRCLDFTPFPSLDHMSSSSLSDGTATNTDLMLASGSQDGYIRLWRVTPIAGNAVEKQTNKQENELDDEMLDEFEREVSGDMGGSRQLSTKSHVVAVQTQDQALTHFGITLEALLIGHEGKLTNAHFSPTNLYSTPHLLSTAADNSMIIWAPETQALGGNALWLPKHRFGELGAGKALGMFGALWVQNQAQNGVDVVANGWNGGLQRWTRQMGHEEEDWTASLAPTGHLLPVQSIAWDPDTSYLVSVSTDQTSRIHAPCTSPGTQDVTWGELGRPQVHGYDMTCVAFLGKLRIASGADEKVVRVFDAPKGFAGSLYGLGVTRDDLTSSAVAVGASVPPLGLSNRALDQAVEPEAQSDDKGFNQEHISISDAMTSLPTETVLATSTLWPEIEKLYGHGYELMAIAASPLGDLLATACKATTAEHAVIRVYNTTTWKQVGTPLPGHTLTIASMAFSGNGAYLLSCSRDRTWRLFKRGPDDAFEPIAADRSHARIVWDCAWSPSNDYFVTVSRDKQIKLWKRGQEGVDTKWIEACTTKGKESVTAVDLVRDEAGQRDLMAVGMESGALEVFEIRQGGDIVQSILKLDASDSHVMQVQRIAWRTISPGIHELASCSEDRSVRVTRITL